MCLFCAPNSFFFVSHWHILFRSLIFQLGNCFDCMIWVLHILANRQKKNYQNQALAFSKWNGAEWASWNWKEHGNKVKLILITTKPSVHISRLRLGWECGGNADTHFIFIQWTKNIFYDQENCQRIKIASQKIKQNRMKEKTARRIRKSSEMPIVNLVRSISSAIYLRSWIPLNW